MEPWQNWAIASILIGGAAYYYSITGGQKKRPSGFKPYIPKQARRNTSRPHNANKDKRRNGKEISRSGLLPEDTADGATNSAPGGAAEAGKRRKEPKRQQQSSKVVPASNVEGSSERDKGTAQDNEGMDNLEFAKQLSDKMTGTSLKKPDSSTNNMTSRPTKRAEASLAGANGRVSKADGGTSVQENSTASSTTGADADDDLSSANSPELGATNTITPSTRDVSDMLQPPAKGPSVLRLTEPENAQHQQQQPKPQKPFQETENKKQRQNRRKKEEQKELREQAEKERRVALENQRRIVREAEGRPSKNGLGSPQATASKAWSSPSVAGESSTTREAVASNQTQLLDTFEEATPPAPTVEKKFDDLPSEEDQMKMLSEMESDNAWNTVSKGGKSKKKAANPQGLSGNSPTDAANSEKDGASDKGNGNSSSPRVIPSAAESVGAIDGKPTQSAPDAGDKPSKPRKATRETIDHSVWNFSNIHEHPDYDPAFPYALTGHPEDSEWAVV
ncbi:MAG: hypothetical protein Q9163_003071 [Psora crenata]